MRNFVLYHTIKVAEFTLFLVLLLFLLLLSSLFKLLFEFLGGKGRVVWVGLLVHLERVLQILHFFLNFRLLFKHELLFFVWLDFTLLYLVFGLVDLLQLLLLVSQFFMDDVDEVVAGLAPLLDLLAFLGCLLVITHI